MLEKATITKLQPPVEEKILVMFNPEEYTLGKEINYAKVGVPGLNSPVLQFVQRVRDEAHRFAIGFHRQARSKRTLHSELDDIPGIGPIKRRKLLSRFGSLRGVRGASIEELATAVGRAVAVRIRAWMDRTPGPLA